MTAAGDYRTSAPTQALDPLLWRDGHLLASSHQPSAADPGRCTQPLCTETYPCRGRRLAGHAIQASLAGWPQCWTARHDLRSYGRPR